ncbi:flagellar biosynthetic protein FliO [Cellulosimicrobium funkei]|uniref:FliO/MopB family protein n=1 Tax=Cellulosimicrobium funkei TaxID=264251 RepID=UPI00203DBE77|nr:flagellar biosynthetic protein FliO [Cellulosimicrobium funkei]MCM3536266.1 flagellar biosynthetic protein FliO [Cellulosimicrobium funkei]
MDVTTVLRVAFSLAVVLGLLWVSYRVASKTSRSAPRGRQEQLTVVARQGLSQKSAAVLLEAGGRRYLLGVTESSVTVIDGPTPVPSDVPPTAVTTVTAADATPGAPTSDEPSFDDAVTAARLWLAQPPANGDAPAWNGEPGSVPADVPGDVPPAVSGPRAGALTTAVVAPPVPTSALRTFLAPDTWRKAARVVRGGAR